MVDVMIRPLQMEDIDAIYAMRRQESVIWGTLAMPSGNRERFRKQALQILDDPRRHAFVAVLDQQVVGSIDLKQLAGRLSHTGQLGMAVDENFHRQGIGTALLNYLIQFNQKWLKLKRIELEVYPDNTPAVKLYKKAGFMEEGRKKQAALREGVYVDLLIMAKVEDD